MSHITAHVLDSMLGVPARGVEITLMSAAGDTIATATTNDDGRVGELGPETLEPGDYRIVFAVGDYFRHRGQGHFHPSVTIDFSVQAGEAHYHIPLLLSPFAYTTYRGS